MLATYVKTPYSFTNDVIKFISEQDKVNWFESLEPF